MPFRFPHDVDGWLSEEEGQLLASLAVGKRALEVGSYCGRSTICLAQTAAWVHSVDPFDGRATERPRDTYPDFVANLRRYGLHPEACVTVHRMSAGDPGLQLPAGFDLAFIDGAHDEASVIRDADLALRVLDKGGLIAFHDYRSGKDPGVTEAVNRLIADGVLEEVSATGSILVTRRAATTPAAHGGPAVYLALPSYDGRARVLSSQAAFLANSRKARVYAAPMMSSSLPLNFNQLWASALNLRATHGITHFAMLHDDVEPQSYWLDVLLEELEASGADVVSAVAPIKDDEGLTSTAIDDPADRYAPLFRLSTAQADHLPGTFTAANCGHPDKALLVNTGCWVCRFAGDWPERFALEAGFNQHSSIVKVGDTFKARLNPEDWEFSRWLWANGLRTAATTKVRLHHVGVYRFPSDQPWGHWYDRHCPAAAEGPAPPAELAETGGGA